MDGRSTPLLEAVGGEAGCRRLSAAFYERVGTDRVLRPLFPGKSLRCAINEFAAFLIQFLGGDGEQTQDRWWVSLRESHARFRIGPTEHRAWLKHMNATLEAAPIEEETRKALSRFFSNASTYVAGKATAAGLEGGELADRWSEQLVLEEIIEAIAAGDDRRVLTLAPRVASRAPAFAGLLARMIQSGRPALIRFVVEALEGEPALAARRYGGKAPLHFAAAAGCIEVVTLLLRLGNSPDVPDRGGHSPLYSAANECASDSGAEVVRILLRAGADVNACGGVTRATPLHMAARRGHVEIAAVLLEGGAAVTARDAKGDTPLQRAVNCRRGAVARLLAEHGSTGKTLVERVGGDGEPDRNDDGPHRRRR